MRPLLSWRAFERCLSGVIFLVAFCSSVQCQLVTAEEKGLPPNSVFHVGDIDVVNLQNGNLHLSIPLFSAKQRGGTTLQWQLVYDTPGWKKEWVSDCPPPTYEVIQCSGSGCPLEQPVEPCNPTANGHFQVSANDGLSMDWRLSSPADWDISFDELEETCPLPTNVIQEEDYTKTFLEGYFYTRNWQLHDWQGTGHPLPLRTEYQPDRPTPGPCQGQQLSGPALDGSGLFYHAGPSGQPYDIGAGFTKSGEQWLGSGNFRDTNGNLFSATVDTLGRNLVTKTYDPNYNPSDPTSRPVYEIYTVKNSAGTSEQYRLDFVTVHMVSNVCAQWGGLPSTLLQGFQCNESGGDVPEIGKITLPNGKAYTFHYTNNTPGDIAQIDLPTGASVAYEYNDFYQQNAAPSLGSYPTVVGSRAVSKRTVQVDGNNFSWQYALTVGQNVITDPAGNVQTHMFNHVAADSGNPSINVSSGLYETSVTYADSQNHVLKSVATDYAAEAFTRDMTAANVRPVRVTTTLSNGLVSKVETDYDTFTYTCFMCVGNTATGSRENPTEVREFAYGNGSPGALLRRTDYVYLHTASPQYATLNIVDKPTQVTVYDGSGNKVQETLYEYDNYAAALHPMDASGAVQHDSGYGTAFTQRGNLTAISKWLNTAGGYIQTVRNQYDDAGNLRWTWDANGNQTRYDYTDSWGNSACLPSGGPGKLLPTQTTNAKGQVTSTKYNSCTGSVASVTDPNSQTTSYTYGTLNRLVRTDFPDQSWAATCFSDDPNGSCQNSALYALTTHSGVALQTYAYADGLGRTKQTKQDNDPDGAVLVDMTYDSVGHVSTVSNPYRASESTHGITQSFYDALDRKTEQLNQDGSTETFSYNGNVTSSTDEAGNTYQRTTDALGRLVQVVEPGGLNTTYSYDTLGNLKCADQWGTATVGSPCSGVRSRSFIYDALSRLITSQNPETGTICYGLWSNGNCSGGYDSNGNLVHKTDARNVVSNYTYDALNRLTHKTYSDSTRQLYLSYDGNGEDGNPISWSQNAVGRLTHTSDVTNVASDFTYDVMGRLTAKIDCYPSDCSYGDAQQAGYDLAGNLIDLRYPDGRTITQSFDNAGRLHSIRAGTSQSPGTPYVSQISYHADGTPSAMTYGNGVVDTFTQNSRLQPCHQVVSGPSGNIIDRQYFYNTNDTSSPCASEANNNGNIFHIVDGLGNHANTQNFRYDALNRLTWFEGPNMSGAYRSQSFGYDSFGNLFAGQSYPQAGTSGVGTPSARMFANASFTGSVPAYNANNQLTDATFDCAPPSGVGHYDPAGNMLCSGSQNDLDAQQYTWDAESRLAQVNAQHSGNNYDLAAKYTYDYAGNRIRSDQFSPGNSQATSWREYVFFNGEMLADKDNNGNWTDYVYANGQKIAKTSTSERVVTIAGVASSSSDYEYFPVVNNGGLFNYQVQPGDKLHVRQRNHGCHGGVEFDTDQAATSTWTLTGIATDQNGMYINMDTTPDGVWHDRIFDLSSMAGNHMTQAYVSCYPAGAGSWSVDFTEYTITSADGTVHALYNGASDVSLSWWGSAGMSGLGYTVAPVTTDVNSTHYYLADHLGTTQVELSASGYPVWEGQFAPFGQELDTQPTSMRYKFTGKERDQESGLDYFGARYYASSLGRFVSPDWSSKPEDVPYAQMDDPQSLNLYGYVGNNPLNRTDADGHCPPCSAWDHFAGFVGGVANIIPQTNNMLVDVENVALSPFTSFRFDKLPEIQADAHASQAGLDTGSAFATAYPLAATAAELKAASTVIGTIRTASADEALAARSSDIHGTLSPRTGRSVTTAVGEATNADGSTTRLVSSSEGTLRPAQRAALRTGETAVKGQRGVHAEVNMLNHAKANGQTLTTVAPSRPACPSCAPIMTENNVRVVNPR